MKHSIRFCYMLLKKVVLENYGLYAGKIEFDLVPARKAERKTNYSFWWEKWCRQDYFSRGFEARFVRQKILNDRLTKAEYETYLRSKIHSGVKSVLPPKAARIAIEFDYVALGELTTYYVERSWHLTLDGNND